MAVGTLGHRFTLFGTPADEQDRAQVGELAHQIQEITSESVEVAVVDLGIRLKVVKLLDTKHGSVPLRRGRVAERSFGWTVRFRLLARDYECLPETLAEVQ